MRNYDFNSRESRIYTNLRNTGHTVLVTMPWRDNLTIERSMFRQFSDAADLAPSDFKVVFLENPSDVRGLRERHAAIGCRVLTVVINSEKFSTAWNREEITELFEDVAQARKERTETTIILFSGGVTPLAYEVLVLANVDEYIDMEVTTVKGTKVKYAVNSRGKEVGVYDSVAEVFSYVRDIDVSNYQHVGFLDIDETLLCPRTFIRTWWGGTCCSHFLNDPVDSIKKFDQEALAFLRKVSAAAGIKWVLSSQWRIGLDIEEVKHFGRYLGIPLIDKVKHGGRRPEEIRDWMSRHEIKGKALCLDNEYVDVPGLTMIHVDPRSGVSWNNCRDLADAVGIDIYDVAHSRAQYPLLEPSSIPSVKETEELV